MTDAPQQPTAPVLPAENIGRGLLFALLVIPVGIILWTVIWAIGFIAAIVGFVVAFGAGFLYRFGSGGRVGVVGAVVISLITLVTLVVAFFAGLAWDWATVVADETGSTAFAAIALPGFWDSLFQVLADPEVIQSYAGQFAIALGLGALGCFSVLRSTFKEAKAAAAAPSALYNHPVGEPYVPFGGAAATTPAVGYEAFGDTPPVTPVAPPVTPAADAAPTADVPPVAPEEQPKA